MPLYKAWDMVQGKRKSVGIYVNGGKVTNLHVHWGFWNWRIADHPGGASWDPVHFVPKKKTILHHSHMFLEFSQGCFRGQPPGKLIHVYIVPLLRLLQKDHNAKCFNNEILQYQITFPRRKTSVVITASISSAPSAKITSALPFESAILDEQKYLVPRPLISQPFLFNIKWFQKYSCFPQLEWGKPGGKRCFFKAETYFLKLYLLDDCSTGRDLVMNDTGMSDSPIT